MIGRVWKIDLPVFNGFTCAFFNDSSKIQFNVYELFGYVDNPPLSERFAFSYYLTDVTSPQHIYINIDLTAELFGD